MDEKTGPQETVRVGNLGDEEDRIGLGRDTTAGALHTGFQLAPRDGGSVH